MKWSKKNHSLKCNRSHNPRPQEGRNGPLRKIKKALQLPKETKAGMAQQTCARATPRMETKIGWPKMLHGAAYIRKNTATQDVELTKWYLSESVEQCN